MVALSVGVDFGIELGEGHRLFGFVEVEDSPAGG